MKWIKRIIFVVCLLLIGAAVLAALGYYRATRTPHWYRPPVLSVEQSATAAKRVEDNLARALSMANAAHAREQAIRRYGSASSPPVGEQTFTFTQDELNAALNKWFVPHIADKTRPVAGLELPEGISDPFIALGPNEILLAVTVGGVDKIFSQAFPGRVDAGQSGLAGMFLPDHGVASLCFRPRLDDQGRLDMGTVAISMGTLPVPKALADKLSMAVGRTLPRYQQSARLDASGAANEAALASSLAVLALRALGHQPSPAVFLIPDQGGSFMPMVLKSIDVQAGFISLTLGILDPHDRPVWMDQLRR